jgi:hypothetical protein
VANVGRLPWWEWIPGRSWRIVATVEAADEIPLRLPPGGAVLVGTSRHPKWLAFDCPCKTGHRIMVTLDPAHYPHWTILDEKKLSLSPSVDYRALERRCHYRISRGKIFWVSKKEGRYHGRKR